jgi:glycosyltransferase involved in cell wall biosynthesis
MPYAAEAAFLDHEPPQRERGSILRLVSIARHEPRKGYDVLLHALAQLKADGVPFRARLIGGGPLLGEHRALASRLGLDDCVAIEGVVPDVRPILDAADAFVLPSREEQSGSLAILEALQSGLPIVAAAVDGILEDLSQDDALLVPPADVPAFAAALTRVLTDDLLRARLQIRARQIFEERFSAPPFAAALGSIYRELLGD